MWQQWSAYLHALIDVLWITCHIICKVYRNRGAISTVSLYKVLVRQEAAAGAKLMSMIAGLLNMMP